jgi:histidinol-phosphate aminotransferase
VKYYLAVMSPFFFTSFSVDRLMKTVTELFCKSALAMTSYAPIEPPDRIAARLGLSEDRIIKLDANENPYGTATEVLQALASGKYYHIYPDPAQVNLRHLIAVYAGCDPESVVAGTGADELIDLICRLVLEPGEKAIGFSPTFSYYSHVVALNRGIYEDHPREPDFSIDLAKAQRIDLTDVKIVMLCSPNNPSGNLLEESVLDYFLSQNVLVMVDEAYQEFSGTTFLEKRKAHPNLVVLRTFSKCFGLAGLRVGYAIAPVEITHSLMRIKPPFSVNVAAEVAVETCLNRLSVYREQVAEIIRTRETVQEALSRYEQLVVYPSRANFILCRVIGVDAPELHATLQREGILLRYFATPVLKDFLRISVGTPGQMDCFLSAIKTVLR